MVSADAGWAGGNRYASGVFLACGLVGGLFEQPLVSILKVNRFSVTEN
jgi:hypothetical protein